MHNQTLLLIDGFNLLSRGYFATSYGRTEEELQKNSKGVYTNALTIFFQKMLNLVNEYQVTHLAVAWDVKREETKRRIDYDFYKATRSELPAPLIQQYEICKNVLDNINIEQLITPPYEADDAIGTVSSKWSSETNGHCYIYSNDRDLFQLLNENVSQVIAGKKGDIVYTINHFREDYSIEPNKWVDVKALLGDKSDNIPGCPGIGEKSALPLIQHYGSLERVYDHVEELDKKFNRCKKKLVEGKETAFISKQLAQIICDIPSLKEINFDKLKLNVLNEKFLSELEDLELRIRMVHINVF
ncbi:5'-3' exonuclease H3TH domain-containing protein [Bacillus songklensis]|uniref:5'-3' exonuclease n=1 Tax=Bacillus songklensis TaxID=1069116 RepID=A0ABV8AW51_9BACI